MWMRYVFLRAASAASLLLLPALLRQGRRVRRETPRLPDAAGPRVGVVSAVSDDDRRDEGDAVPLELLVVGESTAAGVGAADHGEGLAGQAALGLARRTGRAVRWRVVGRTGIAAGEAARELVAEAVSEPADVVVLAFGVNDTLRFHSPRRWTRDLRALVEGLRAEGSDLAVVLSAVPPMGRFPALPQPLRAVLGLRARVLDGAARRLAGGMARARHVAMPEMVDDDVGPFFCADRFHPSPRGYAVWGAALGDACARLLDSAR